MPWYWVLAEAGAIADGTEATVEAAVESLRLLAQCAVIGASPALLTVSVRRIKLAMASGCPQLVVKIFYELESGNKLVRPPGV